MLNCGYLTMQHILQALLPFTGRERGALRMGLIPPVLAIALNLGGLLSGNILALQICLK